MRKALISLLCALWSALTSGHPMPESRVWIDTTPAGLQLTLQLPLNRLEFAFGMPLADNPQTVLPLHGEALSRYLLQHVGVRSNNVGWQVMRPQLKVVGDDSTAELEAVFELRAPDVAHARASPTLLYDVISHEVRTHRAQVFLRNDWMGGFAGVPPLLLGELHHGQTRLTIALRERSTGASLLRLLRDGAMHIAEGTDHLLFLLMLLIVAPLQAHAARWAAVRPVRSALRHVVVVVTAFTAGHSLTLVLGSTGVLSLPSQPVEIAVAATITIAAIHALRPLFAASEVVMALGFGLIHGFAFSASLSGAGLTVSQHAQALLAFNIGIEAMQLAVLVAVLPPLLIVSLTVPELYATLRRLAAVAAALLSIIWLVERTGGSTLEVASPAHSVWAAAPLLGAIWSAALFYYFRRRRLPASAPSEQR
jgi:hypothetical protein